MLKYHSLYYQHLKYLHLFSYLLRLKDHLRQGLEAYRNSLKSEVNYRSHINHAEALMNKGLEKVALQHLHHLQQTLKSENSAHNAIHLLDTLGIENRVMHQADGNHTAQRAARIQGLADGLV